MCGIAKHFKVKSSGKISIVADGVVGSVVAGASTVSWRQAGGYQGNEISPVVSTSAASAVFSAFSWAFHFNSKTSDNTGVKS